MRFLKWALNLPTVLYYLAKWFAVAWVENYITPALKYVSELTGIPMQVIEGIIIGGLFVGSIFWTFGKFWQKSSISVEERHRFYVSEKIVDSKADALLILSDALQKLREMDTQLVDKSRGQEIQDSVLKRIQNRLKEDWKVSLSEIDNNAVTIQEVQDVIAKTVSQNKLKFTKEDENTLAFMLHVAGVLDDEGLGISRQRETDERFILVEKLKANVSTDALRNAIRIFVWYSLGINSMMLLIAYFPTDSVQGMMRALGTTSAELKGERDQTLSYLLTKINYLRDQELTRIKW